MSLDTDTNIATCERPCPLRSMISYRREVIGGEGIICTAISKQGEVINGGYHHLIPEGKIAGAIINTDYFPLCSFPNTEIPQKG